jgi:hypothetical protein
VHLEVVSVCDANEHYGVVVGVVSHLNKHVLCDSVLIATLTFPRRKHVAVRLLFLRAIPSRSERARLILEKEWLRHFVQIRPHREYLEIDACALRVGVDHVHDFVHSVLALRRMLML